MTTPENNKPVQADSDPLHSHWREVYQKEAYYREGYSYEDYGPAYTAGHDLATKQPEKNYEEHESDLAHNWHIYRGDSKLDWKEASPAVRAAWERTKLHRLDV